jgi:hypothetical protein
VAGGGPVTGRREGEVSSMLHEQKMARGGSAPLTVGVLTTVKAAGQQRSGRSDSDGRLQTEQRRCRDGQGEARRGGSDSGGGAIGTALSGPRRAVPTTHLTRWSSAARGSHVATACCQAGPARRAVSNRWDPLISVFQIKISP